MDMRRLKDTNATLILENQSHLDTISQNKTKIEELQSENNTRIEELQIENQSHLSTIKQKQRIIDELTLQNTENQAQIEELTRLIEEARKQIKEKNDRIENVLRVERDELKVAKERLEQTVKENEETIKSLKANINKELAQRDAVIHDKELERQTLEKELQAAVRERTKLDSDLKKAKADHAEQFANQSERIMGLSADLLQKQKEFDKTIQTLNQKVAAQTSELEELKGEFQETSNHLRKRGSNNISTRSLQRRIGVL